jgi:hypothetical protein
MAHRARREPLSSGVLSLASGRRGGTVGLQRTAEFRIPTIAVSDSASRMPTGDPSRASLRPALPRAPGRGSRRAAPKTPPAAIRRTAAQDRPMRHDSISLRALLASFATTSTLCLSSALGQNFFQEIGYVDLLARLGGNVPTGASIGVGQVEAATSGMYGPNQTDAEFADVGLHRDERRSWEQRPRHDGGEALVRQRQQRRARRDQGVAVRGGELAPARVSARRVGHFGAAACAALSAAGLQQQLGGRRAGVRERVPAPRRLRHPPRRHAALQRDEQRWRRLPDVDGPGVQRSRGRSRRWPACQRPHAGGDRRARSPEAGDRRSGKRDELDHADCDCHRWLPRRHGGGRPQSGAQPKRRPLGG